MTSEIFPLYVHVCLLVLAVSACAFVLSFKCIV